jgi:hypothetical protein
MNSCFHRDLTVHQVARPSALAFYEVPVASLNSIAEPGKARACAHSERLSAPGWYVVFSRHGLRATAAKVGQSGSVLSRVRGQASEFDPHSAVLMAVTASDSRIDEQLRERVERSIGCTLSRAAAHGLLTTTYREGFKKVADARVDATQADALTVDVLHGVADALGCGAWQLLRVRQRSGSLWPPSLRRGNNRDTLRRLLGMFDAGLISPGDRLAVLGGPVVVTVTEQLLCRIGTEREQLTPRQAVDTVLSRGKYSPHTKRNAWDALTVVSCDNRNGQSLGQLRRAVPHALAQLTSRCHMR